MQDFWGDPLTAAGSQSPDGKAAYVQVFLAGNQGEALSLESVDALRDIIAKTPAPPGIHAYVAGSAAQIADQFEVGNESTVMVTALTVGVIAVMLLIVYRSPVTMIVALVTVLIEMAGPRDRRVPRERRSHRPVDVFDQPPHAAGHRRRYRLHHLPARPISRAAQRRHGPGGRLLRHVPRDVARDTGFRADHRRRGGLPDLHPVAVLPEPGHPAAIGVLVSLVASLTLAPAVLVVGSRFGLLEPKRKTAKRGWRRIGTAIVRWPGPILIATLALAFVGLAALSGYKVSYDISRYMPASAPSNVGYAARASLLEGAAESRTADDRNRPRSTQSHRHDPAGARGQGRLPHRRHRAGAVDHAPLGTPLDHTSIPFQISAQSAAQINNLPYQQDRAADLLKQVGVINDSIDVLRQQYALQQQSSAVTHEQTVAFQQTVAVAQDLRDKIANFDDFFRPLRNYFYWEPHCFDIPICWALRSLFDALDGINALTDQLANVSGASPSWMSCSRSCLR